MPAGRRQHLESTRDRQFRFETLEARRLLAVTCRSSRSISTRDLNQEIVGFGSSMIDWYSPSRTPTRVLQRHRRRPRRDGGARAGAAGFERKNDNDDPRGQRRGFNSRKLATSLEYVQELKERVDHTVMATVWSPPSG